jgi:hypothetical protein
MRVLSVLAQIDCVFFSGLLELLIVNNGLHGLGVPQELDELFGGLVTFDCPDGCIWPLNHEEQHISVVLQPVFENGDQTLWFYAKFVDL